MRRTLGLLIFQGNFAFALVYELLENRQVQEAVAFQRMYRSFGQDLVKKFVSAGDRYLRSRRQVARTEALRESPYTRSRERRSRRSAEENARGQQRLNGIGGCSRTGDRRDPHHP